MGVDVYYEVKIPSEVSRKELEKCFIKGKSSDINYWYWYPTSEYLDAFLACFKERTISRLKYINPKMSEEEIEKEFKNNYNEAELLEYFAHSTIYEKKKNSGNKNGDGSLVLSDTCRVQSYGSLLQYPSLISKFFPNVKIEMNYSDDFGNGSIDIYLNGERIESNEEW